jgi:hypothetical protein
MNIDNQMPTSSIQSNQKQHATLALEITEQDWSMLGLQDEACPNVATSASLELTAERITSLFLIRLVALAAPSHRFSDLSTTTICQTILSSRYVTSCWPETITETVIQELRCFVRVILGGYNKIPYHNFEHAYQVTISANKLMDLVLQSRPFEPVKISSHSLLFEEDPLMHLALLFAALIHDVEHQGVPNQQLVLENDPLALQYNDRSVAEQRSLCIGFMELLKTDYDDLRQVMFPFTFVGDGYRRFRETVTKLVLATDIASPERGDIVKKKWEKSFEERPLQTPHRVIGHTKGRRKAKTAPAPLLKPPKEHLTPNRHRNLVKHTVEEQKELSRKTSLESWVELGATPSTHFPIDAGSSMHDSLVFWWFHPTQSEDKDESDSHSSSEDENDFFSTYRQKMDLPNNAFNEDLDASITLFPEAEKDSPTTNANLSDEYNYPHTSQASFQFSCSTFGDSSFQHLLSPSKVSRLNRVVSQSSTNLPSDNRTGMGAYCDLSITSGDDDQFLALKPRGLLETLASCTPKRKANRKSSVIFEINSMVSKFTTIDLTSSSMAPTDANSTDFSCNTASSSKLRSGPSQELGESERTEPDRSCGDTDASEVRYSKIPEDSVEDRDEELCKMSLLEHILLVSDVAHTMQGWDLMIKFAHRLSEEIQSAVTAGRSGGNLDDPLSDWYNNQSAFLHRYVLPLAERLEETGYIPVSEDRKERFLSDIVNSNLSRWQEHGHDVVLAWRREKTQKKINKKDKAKKKSKGGKDLEGKRRHEKKRPSKATKDCSRSRDHIDSVAIQYDDMLMGKYR